MARTIQQIFNKVIKEGYYPRGGKHPSFQYMCAALQYSAGAKVITGDEATKAKKSISKYLEPTGKTTLAAALRGTNAILNTVEERLAIYKDWKNRPALLPAPANE